MWTRNHIKILRWLSSFLKMFFSPPNSVLMDCRGGEEELSIKEARGEQRNTLIIKRAGKQRLYVEEMA